MNKKIKRKVHLLDYWDVQEHETMFHDMDSKGWKLININHFISTFAKDTKTNSTYSYDIFKKSDNEKFNFYKEAGWEYVGSRVNVHYFRKDKQGTQTASQLFTRKEEQVESIIQLRRTHVSRTLMISILSIILLFLSISTLQINPVNNFLEDLYIAESIRALSFLTLLLYISLGIFKLNRTIKNINTGINRKINYRKKEIFNLLTILIMLVLILSSLYLQVNNRHSLYNSRGEIPSKLLPTFQLTDIQPENNITSTNDYFSNYYAQSSSILVPNQQELSEYADIDGQNTSHHSFTYELRNEWLAKRFFHDLREYNYFTNNLKPSQHEWFDELWIDEDTYSTFFIARRGEKVYLVNYFGEHTITELLDTFYLKLKNMGHS
ncbi:MAG: DUF2812 domain-containing protein [Bacillaceae bacterium]|mgnify:FL=1|nr:DUF2812 domain-containing protein [Bacillaceae bacterium]